MPLLDVSAVLNDPLFASPLTLIRSTGAVDDGGLASVTEVASTISGVVEADPSGMLRLTADAAMAAGAITVHTTAPLRTVTDEGPADMLVWQGRRYTVVNVSDWSQYGAGFYEAMAALKPVTA